MTPKVLLFTTVRWPSAARIAGAFAGAEAEVHALYPRRHMLALSRFVTASHAYEPLLPQASVRSAIANSAPDLIVPLDDRATRYIASLASDASLAPLIERSLGNPGVYAQLMSRSGFIAAAREAGIPAPEAVSVVAVSGIDDAIGEIGLPAFLKSDGSWGGAGVVFVHTREEARAAYQRLSAVPSRWRTVLRALRRRDAHFVLDAVTPSAPSISMQRFISGHPATTSMACWDGKVLAATHLDVVVSKGTGPACVVRPVDCAEMQDAAERLASRFHLSGLHGLDFIRDAQGHVHLIEINPRATQTSHIPLDAGRDLMTPLVARAARKAIPARPAIALEDAIALFPQEWSRDPASPYLLSAYHDVPWDDPAVLLACLDAAELPAARIEAFFTSWKPSSRTIPAP